jgi:glycolate dehydrogenase FAD-binding subunit
VWEAEVAIVSVHAQSELAAIVGEARVATDEASRQKFAIDGKLPEMVVYPSTAEEVAAVLKHAAENNLAVVPCRNATKLMMGNPPRRYDVALCLKSMNNVWYYEPADLVISAEAGMRLGDFQQFIGRDGLWLPLDPPGGAQGSLGGILAANAAGPMRILHGSPRDMVLGMKVATTEGKVIKTGGRVVKNVAGYDLGKLLIGSYGTLGVIVEATVKLFPRPAARETYRLVTGTLGIARELHKRILESSLQPLRIVLLDSEARSLVASNDDSGQQAGGPEIWIEACGSKAVLARIRRDVEGMASAAGSAPAAMDSQSAAAAWERIADFGNSMMIADPQSVVMKAALPIVAVEGFLSRAQQTVENENIRMAGIAQLGVGIVYVGMFPDEKRGTVEAAIRGLREAAAELGGALVIERAPAELKKRLDVWGSAGDDFEVMRRVKTTWDPRGILSPGRFLGGI